VSDIPPFGVRIQPDLKELIEQAARASGRSLNAEIVARLQDSFDVLPENESVLRDLPPESLELLTKRLAAHETRLHELETVWREIEKLRAQIRGLGAQLYAIGGDAQTVDSSNTIESASLNLVRGIKGE